jgi:hypothetical protein
MYHTMIRYVAPKIRTKDGNVDNEENLRLWIQLRYAFEFLLLNVDESKDVLLILIETYFLFTELLML